MGSGDLLDVVPLELKFPCKFPLFLHLRSFRLLPPEVTMQAQPEAPPDMQCKDKFLLQSIATSSTTTLNDITQEMFSKEPGKTVDEVKIQVAYVPPPQPPSNVYEQSEDGGASPTPFSSDKASMISREYATVPESVGGSPKAACLLVGELDVGNGENAAAAELRREAKEHIAVVGNAVESVGQQRNRVDSVLVAEKGSGEARHRVADGPGRVAFEADDLVRAVHHRLPDPLQHSLLDCRHILRELAQYWHSPHAYARPQRHGAVSVLPHHVCLPKHSSDLRYEHNRSKPYR
ncbi:hypothetical protein BHE74_00001755 [Ensete ventricosum]|nr:hypothetical protein BHE74_00001755 [Ensete ventricosum]RZR77717.1 hypothetical protein BHM03_00002842 [Ensete ventricosum]